MCDKQLSTHYRKQSIALHPDRNGEHLRGEFDQFKIFMDVLRVGEKRTQYFGQMLKVQKTMPQYTAHGHEVWMKSNTEQEDEELNEEVSSDDLPALNEPSARPHTHTHTSGPRLRRCEQRRHFKASCVALSFANRPKTPMRCSDVAAQHHRPPLFTHA